MAGVTGSNPVARTIQIPINSGNILRRKRRDDVSCAHEHRKLHGEGEAPDRLFPGLGYIGLQVKADFGKWSLGAKVIGSWWVSSHDEDNHHIREVLFTEKFGTSEMVGASAEVGYKLSNALTLNVTYDYLRWGRAKGP